jgi:hypothetical protein
MPIIRSELQTFVDTHNAHPIRAQPKRAHHVAGVPDELYSDRSRQRPHSVSGLEPQLALAPKSYVDVDELVRSQLLRDLGYEVPP